MGEKKKKESQIDSDDTFKRDPNNPLSSEGIITYISGLSERAENIRLHPELLDSIKDTDPIWNELFDYVINSCTPFTVEGEVSIKEKIKIVRCWLPPDDPDTELWT